MRIERPPRALLEELIAEHGYEDTPTVYIDRQPLVRELFWRRLEALLSLSRAGGGRVLDFGGGNGVLLSPLAAMFDEVVCVDVHASLAQVLCERQGLGDRVSIRQGRLEELELPSGSFDTIVAADVLEHIEDPPPLAAELARLLRPGGELLVSLPTENRFYELGRSVFGYTKPDDHYHEGDDVVAFLSKSLSLQVRRHFPVDVPWLGVFLLARLTRDEAAGG